MIWVHLVGLLFFVSSKWMDVHVVYQEVCPLPFPPRNDKERTADIQAFIKVGQSVTPRPWQLWTAGQQTTYRISAYLVTVTFWALQVAHAEEVSPYPFLTPSPWLGTRKWSVADPQMIFWGYLIRAIRNPNNACAAAPRVWIKAPCFRFWIAISVSTGLLLFGAASIEIKDLDAQRVCPFPPHEEYELTISHTSTS
jgi:hypothetical protein